MRENTPAPPHSSFCACSSRACEMPVGIGGGTVGRATSASATLADGPPRCVALEPPLGAVASARRAVALSAARSTWRCGGNFGEPGWPEAIAPEASAIASRSRRPPACASGTRRSPRTRSIAPPPGAAIVPEAGCAAPDAHPLATREPIAVVVEPVGSEAWLSPRPPGGAWVTWTSPATRVGLPGSGATAIGRPSASRRGGLVVGADTPTRPAVWFVPAGRAGPAPADRSDMPSSSGVGGIVR